MHVLGNLAAPPEIVEHVGRVLVHSAFSAGAAAVWCCGRRLYPLSLTDAMVSRACAAWQLGSEGVYTKQVAAPRICEHRHDWW